MAREVNYLRDVKITQRRRGRGEFFCGGKFSHGGHGETEELTFGKISHRGTEGTEGTEGLALGARGGLFTRWKNHAEARRARRIFLRWGILARRARRDGGAHIGENITQRHRGHIGARAWRASRIFIWMEKSRRGAEGAEFFLRWEILARRARRHGGARAWRTRWDFCAEGA